MHCEVVCIITFKAKYGKINELRETLISLVEPTRCEKGCIDYTLHECLEQPGIFTLIERFKDKNSFDSHLKQPYIIEFRDKINNLITNELPNTQLLRPIK